MKMSQNNTHLPKRTKKYCKELAFKDNFGPRHAFGQFQIFWTLSGVMGHKRKRKKWI